MSATTDLQLILNDSGVFWPTQNLFDALNEAQMFLAAETAWKINQSPMGTLVSITQGFLSSNADVIPFTDPAFGQGFVIPKWIEGTNYNFQPPVVKRFFPTTQRNLEHYLRTWKGDNKGQPMYFTIWDAYHFRVYPRPDQNNVYAFTLFYVTTPPTITTTGQNLTGPIQYQKAVTLHAASILLEATRPDLADLYASQAATQVLAFKKQLRNQQSHNLRTLKPATTPLELDQAGQIYELPSYYPLES